MAPAVASSGQFELLASDGARLQLSHLSPALRITSTQAAATHTVACPTAIEEPVVVEAQCPAVDPSTPPATVTAICNGSASSVVVACPPAPAACVFWNETSQAWSRQGVRATGVRAAGGHTIVGCESSHASEFAGQPWSRAAPHTTPPPPLVVSMAQSSRLGLHLSLLSPQPNCPSCVVALVLSYVAGQLQVLGTLVRQPDLIRRDYSIAVALGLLWAIFLGVMWAGSRRKGDMQVLSWPSGDRYVGHAGRTPGADVALG